MGLRGPLRPENNLGNIVSFSDPSEDRGEQTSKKTQTGLSLSLLSSPSPATHRPQGLTAPNSGRDRISPRTSKHNMEIKHTYKHTHCPCYTTHTLVSAVILTMLAGDLGCRVGGWVKRGRGYRRRGGRPLGRSERKAVNVFMEKSGLTTRPNRVLRWSFMGAGQHLQML